MNANGPFDEPSFCFENGVISGGTDNGFYRQAVAAFDRVRQLVPDNLRRAALARRKFTC